MLSMNLPARFVLARTRLSRQEALRALDCGWFGPDQAVALAAHRVGRLREAADWEVELAGRLPNDSVYETVRLLAAGEPPQDPERVDDKWYHLLLAWLYHYLVPVWENGRRAEVYQALEVARAELGKLRYGPDRADRVGALLCPEKADAAFVERLEDHLRETAGVLGKSA